jgi:hypothetical protein
MNYLDKIKIAIKDIINQMFIISGNDCTYDQIENRTDFWFNQMTMTNEQFEEWQKWGTNYLRKKLKFKKKLAEQEMGMIGLKYGLRIDDKIVEREKKINELLK